MVIFHSYVSLPEGMCCLRLHAFYPTTGEISIVFSLIIPTSPATFRRAALWNFLASRVKNRSGMIGKFKKYVERCGEELVSAPSSPHVSYIYIYVCIYICIFIPSKVIYQYGHMMMLRYGTGIYLYYISIWQFFISPGGPSSKSQMHQKSSSWVNGNTPQKSRENHGKIGKSLIRHGTHAVSCSIYEILLAFLSFANSLPTAQWRCAAASHDVGIAWCSMQCQHTQLSAQSPGRMLSFTTLW